MENFIVSARKYRPVTFDTVVGQNAITSTLKNAIKTNHLAQAYLFCGPRGVGKTTCARIFAKTINCTNLSPEVEACNVCDPCLSFNESNSFNVFELDAASNNSVDDIRTLVDQVRIPPQNGQYKIYIIDEVHMLSASAFNAFLKTLEEPPPYAKFILATTEKHKIIPTILSRCQVFDFNRITIEDIAKHLAFVAKNENVKAEAEGLHVIAQKADGALRDALSIFDQLVSFSGEDGITYKSVLQNLNVLDYDYYFKATSYLLSGNTSEILMLINEVVDHGFDGHHFITGLGEHLRNLMVSKDPVTIKLIEVSDSLRERYNDQSKQCSVPFLMKALELASKCDLNYKIVTNKRLLLELTMLQMCPQLNTQNPISSNTELPKVTEKHIHAPMVAKSVTPPVVEIKPEKKPEVISEKVNNTIVEIPKTDTPVVEELKDDSSIAEEPKADNTIVIEQKVEVTVVEEPKTEIIKDTPLVKNKIKNSTPSILDQLEEAENAANINESATSYGDATDEFSQEKLAEVWAKYLATIIKTNVEAAAVVQVRIPEIKENFALELVVDNPVADSEIQSIRLDLVEFLRTELNNHKVILSTRLEVEATEAKPFTAAEKFNKMASKNPDLQKLKDKFDLELDF
jgi:DNA polymerase III subunit gamma/tau